MVRIFKVNELDDQKKLLVARSQMYRETIRLEVANVKFSLALMKRKLGFARSAVGVLGVAAPVIGLLLGLRGFRKGETPKLPGRQSLFSRIMAGAQMLRQFRPLLRLFFERRRSAGEAQEREDTRHFS
jgi:hypothetical protein